MSEIVEFLLARLAEDETDARAAEGGRWRWEQGYGEMCNDPECPFGQLMSERPDGQLVLLMDVHGYDVHEGWEGAAHIARHDPARVLAEVEAKRRIVWAVTDWLDTHPDEDHVPAGDDALCWLALPYADHEHYRQEWRP